MPFSALPEASVPRGEGVYVVLRPTDAAPEFVSAGSGGWFKAKDPNVPETDLKAAWVGGTQVVYVGKAALGASGRRGLAKRLSEYRRFGAGEPVGHWGGRYIWQLRDAVELLVAWRETPNEDSGAVETGYIADFVRQYGKRPFANRRG